MTVLALSSPEAEAVPSTALLPKHIAVIMDGNGRWAQARGLPRAAGHRAGVEAARRAVDGCLEHGIRYLTLFAFSTENWCRPQGEIGELLELFRTRLESLGDNIPSGVRVRFVGDRSSLDLRLRRLMEGTEERESGRERLLVSVALNYGGRSEIVEAARRLAQRAAKGEIDPARIDEQMFASELSAAGVPDPDLVVRTAGEQRLSNFLLWQSAYSELVFLDCFWPEFDQEFLAMALGLFAQRERRYGGVPAGQP